MSLSRYRERVEATVGEKGIIGGVVESIRLPYVKALKSLNRFGDAGTNIYEEEWELLIIVDACRFDLMEEVLQRRDEFPSRIQFKYSVDSATYPWMRKTFIPEYLDQMDKTTYIVGNPYSHHELDDSQFQLLDEVWKKYWDDSLGTLPARPVTDRAIEIARTNEPSQMIVHYMQPHCPFLNYMDISRRKSATEFGDSGHGPDVWERLRLGEVSREEVWKGYKDNLEYVLDDVQLLLENVPLDDVVLTSDHGNALGDRWLYGHPWEMPVSCLRKVPWVELSGTDSGEYEPDLAAETGNTNSDDVENRLAALGYR